MAPVRVRTFPQSARSNGIMVRFLVSSLDFSTLSVARSKLHIRLIDSFLRQDLSKYSSSIPLRMCKSGNSAHLNGDGVMIEKLVGPSLRAKVT